MRAVSELQTWELFCSSKQGWSLSNCGIFSQMSSAILWFQTWNADLYWTSSTKLNWTELQLNQSAFSQWRGRSLWAESRCDDSTSSCLHWQCGNHFDLVWMWQTGSSSNHRASSFSIRPVGFFLMSLCVKQSFWACCLKASDVCVAPVVCLCLLVLVSLLAAAKADWGLADWRKSEKRWTDLSSCVAPSFARRGADCFPTCRCGCTWPHPLIVRQDREKHKRNRGKEKQVPTGVSQGRLKNNTINEWKAH